MPNPISADLNRAVLLMAPAFQVLDALPEITTGYPIARFSALVRERGIMPVWSGASDGTIYADAHVNRAFRAWHDECHIAGQFGFTLQGERATCELQIRGLKARFPRVPNTLLALIRAEVIGQAEHFALTGSFPVNQAAFNRAYVAAH